MKVSIKNFSKIYDNGDGVRDINLDIQENEILTLLGPSGCGKTTILRSLGGFVEPSGGTILIDGQDVTHLPPEKRPTGMVFQSYNLWPHMNVYENLAFGLKLRKESKATINQKIKEILELVKLPGIERKFPSQLSGGQQQRVAIARALLLQPEVLLLDEPFSALDAKIRVEMREELKRIQQELNLTVVFVTHDQEEAMSISHRIVVMDKGVISQIGTPDEVYDHPNSHYVASFIGEMNFLEKGDKIKAIRPEDVQIGLANELERPATIQTKMVMGHYVMLEIIDQETKEAIKAFTQRKAALELAEGDAISYSVVKSLEFPKEGVGA